MMSRRPRNALNLSLRQLTYNPKTELYDAEEAGIVYHLTFEQMNAVKKYYAGSQGYMPTYCGWYNNLDRFAKKKVKRSGELPEQESGFFPDAEF